MLGELQFSGTLERFGVAGVQLQGVFEALACTLVIAPLKEKIAEVDSGVRQERIELERFVKVAFCFTKPLQGKQDFTAHLPRARFLRIHIDRGNELLVRVPVIINLCIGGPKQEMPYPAVGFKSYCLFETLNGLGICSSSYQELSE